jgi:hypothetical protein
MECARPANRTTLDYLIATHIHPDHGGDVEPQQKPAPGGSFIRTGVSQVDELMPAKIVIDRSYPDYGLLQPLNAPFASNYLAWLDARARSGEIVQPVDVGSDSQVRLRAPMEACGSRHPGVDPYSLGSSRCRPATSRQRTNVRLRFVFRTAISHTLLEGI